MTALEVGIRIVGGGDSYYRSILQKLRERFSFGAYNEHEFDFCGVHYRQWDDGTIETDQRDYIRKIEPINVPQNRRASPDADLSDMGRHFLRGLCRICCCTNKTRFSSKGWTVTSLHSTCKGQRSAGSKSSFV